MRGVTIPSSQNITSTGHPLHALALALGIKPGPDETQCAMCGTSPFDTACTLKKLGNMFNRWEFLPAPQCGQICAGCRYVTGGHASRRPRPVRMMSFLVEGGSFDVLQQAGWWELLNRRPDRPFVASWAKSRKKQHMTSAGWSGGGIWRIGSDEGCIVFEHNEAALKAVVALRDAGARKGHILAGLYTPKLWTRHRETLDRAERVLADFRQDTRALELIVYALPMDYEAKAKQGDKTVALPPEDKIAIEILSTAAYGSQYRVTQGIRFWGGYYEGRIKRFSRFPLPDFVSRLMGEIGSGVAVATKVARRVSEMDEETQIAVSTALRTRTTLLHALAFDEMKTFRERKAK